MTGPRLYTAPPREKLTEAEIEAAIDEMKRRYDEARLRIAPLDRIPPDRIR